MQSSSLEQRTCISRHRTRASKSISQVPGALATSSWRWPFPTRPPPRTPPQAPGLQANSRRQNAATPPVRTMNSPQPEGLHVHSRGQIAATPPVRAPRVSRSRAPHLTHPDAADAAMPHDQSRSRLPSSRRDERPLPGVARHPWTTCHRSRFLRHRCLPRSYRNTASSSSRPRSIASPASTLSYPTTSSNSTTSPTHAGPSIR